MYSHIKKRVIQTLNVNPIITLPIPIHSIEEIISNNCYQILNVGNLSRPCIFEKTVYCPTFKTTSDCRIALSHELGHIICHSREKSTIDAPTKHEAVADAFALYFTMPPYLFEKDIKQLNEWELSEKYGIPIEYVIKRFTLIN